MVPIIALIFSSSMAIFLTTAHSANLCEPASCDGANGPTVKFPFRIINRQPGRCGYPGFDLYCNTQNQTILTLPQSGEFIIDYIDYTRQALLINDPGLCLPNRILNFSFSGSPFYGENLRDYTFLNCTNWTDFNLFQSIPLFCLRTSNYSVLATNLRWSGVQQLRATCRRIAEVSIPMQWAIMMYYGSSLEMGEDYAMFWREPDCRDCENRGGICGYEGDSGLEIGCSGIPRSGLTRVAKYGIIFGVGIPGLIFLIWLASYTTGKIRTSRLRRRLHSTLPTTTPFPDHPLAIRSASGLDGPTIESYPKVVLGESCRLPKPSDSTCPICLSDYQPKETLRSIPECNHYFHADCIDEWLKLNDTCPLCRNSPESSTACSSMSLSFSSSPIE